MAEELLRLDGGEDVAGVVLVGGEEVVVVLAKVRRGFDGLEVGAQHLQELGWDVRRLVEGVAEGDGLFVDAGGLGVECR